MSLPIKEYMSIADMARLEELLIKKYKLYSSICTDKQLKIKYEQVASEHQNHHDTLMKQLN